MRQLLKETRVAVNELLQKQWEESQYVDNQTLFRVNQRAIQTTRDQFEADKLEMEANMQPHGDRLHAMEVGFAELNDWAENHG